MYLPKRGREAVEEEEEQMTTPINDWQCTTFTRTSTNNFHTWIRVDNYPLNYSSSFCCVCVRTRLALCGKTLNYMWTIFSRFVFNILLRTSNKVVQKHRGVFALFETLVCPLDAAAWNCRCLRVIWKEWKIWMIIFLKMLHIILSGRKCKSTCCNFRDVLYPHLGSNENWRDLNYCRSARA